MDSIVVTGGSPLSGKVAIAGAKTQVASGITPDFQVDEPCVETGNQVGNSLFHASFEVIFQRTY